MKKILISLAIIGVVAGITFGITGAWWTDEGVSDNQSFVSGNLNLRLSNDGSSWGDNVSNTWNVDKMTPGGTPYVSTLYMKNTGSVNADYLKFTLKNYPDPAGMDGVMRITKLEYAGKSLLTGGAGGAGADLSTYVAPTHCDITVGSGETYTTIQAGINAAASGNTVCVKAGTYNERLSIGKSLALQGAGAAQTTIDITGLSVQNPNIAIEISSGVSDLTIGGFTIKGSPTFHYADESVMRFNGNNNRITVSNNVINGVYGIIWSVSGGGDTLTVSNNIFVVNKNGIAINSARTNVVISDNTIGPGTSMIGDPSGIYATNCDNCQITGNIITNMVGSDGAGQCIMVPRGNNVVISGNTLTGCGMWGIGWWGSATSYTITNNVISNNGYGNHPPDTRNDGINIGAGTGININNNNIVGNAGDGIDTLVAVNAENNWWGDFDPSDQVTGNVDYTPYAGGPFIGFINGQDLWANGFADLEDFEKSTIVVENPDLLPNSGSYHTLKMGVQLDGPTTSNAFMGGNVGMDMTVTMGQGPAQ